MPMVTPQQCNILQVHATKRTIYTKPSLSNRTQHQSTKSILYKTTTQPLQETNTYSYNPHTSQTPNIHTTTYNNTTHLNINNKMQPRKGH